MKLMAFIERGGPVVAVLILLSAVATTLALVKIWQFHRSGVGRHRNIAEALRSWFAGQAEDAQKLLQAGASPAGRVLHHAMTNQQRFGQNLDAAREDVLRASLEELREMRRYLRGIEVIAQSAPLLGLLGTVIGMIEAFSQLETGGTAADPSRLAGGIWTALLATALGLAIAIVFSMAGAWLESRVDNERSEMEAALSGYFAGRGAAGRPMR